MVEKYGSDAKVLREIKQVLKASNRVPAETLQTVKDSYNALKEQNYTEVLEQLYPGETKVDLETIKKGTEKLARMTEKEDVVDCSQAIDFFIRKATSLLKKTINTPSEEGPTPMDCLQSLISLHKMAIKNSQDNLRNDREMKLLYDLYRFGLKAGLSA